MSIRDSLSFAQKVLSSANISEAVIEAELIWMHVLNVSRHDLYLNNFPNVTDLNVKRVHEILSERLTGKPLAYVLGLWKAYDVDLIISPDVLIPRPESEILIERGIEICRSESIALMTEYRC